MPRLYCSCALNFLQLRYSLGKLVKNQSVFLVQLKNNELEPFRQECKLSHLGINKPSLWSCIRILDAVYLDVDISSWIRNSSARVNERGNNGNQKAFEYIVEEVPRSLRMKSFFLSQCYLQCGYYHGLHRWCCHRYLRASVIWSSLDEASNDIPHSSVHPAFGHKGSVPGEILPR